MEQLIRRTVAEMLAQQGVARHATVVSVNPTDHTMKVQDETGAVSGWLPMVTTGLGNGWFALPKPGAQVFMVPDMGDQGHMVVVGSTATTSNPPPQVQSYGTDGNGDMVYPAAGEATIVHESGAFLRLLPGGVIESRGTWQHAGDLKVSGQIRDLNGSHGTLDDLRTAHNTHRHTNVGTGGGTSNIPTVVTP